MRDSVSIAAVYYHAFEKRKSEIRMEGGLLRVHSMVIPELTIHSARGKPITYIISHPYLTGEINF
jgi:hypothetical protein